MLPEDTERVAIFNFSIFFEGRDPVGVADREGGFPVAAGFSVLEALSSRKTSSSKVDGPPFIPIPDLIGFSSKVRGL